MDKRLRLKSLTEQLIKETQERAEASRRHAEYTVETEKRINALISLINDHASEFDT